MSDDFLKIVIENDLDKAKIYLKENDFEDYENSFGDTPLTVASYNNNIEIVKLILNKVTDKESIINKQTLNGGNTALHLAARNGSENVFLYLLQRGGSLKIKNYKNQTPLDCAKQFSRNFNIQKNKKNCCFLI